MSLKDMATRVAALDTLKRRVADELDAARVELQAAMVEAKAVSGTQRIGFGLGSVELGTATLVDPVATAMVVDDAALMAWVRQVAPSEVTSRVVTEVRPAWRSQLLKDLTAAGEATWVDPVTGEIHEVPGIEFQDRAAYAKVSMPATGKAAMAEAWRTGTVWRLAMPELTAGRDQ